MFTDGLMAAVDLSAGALESSPHAVATATSSEPRKDDLAVQKIRSQKIKRKLLSFVDHQDVGTVEEHLELVQDPYLNRFAQPEPTQLLISDKEDDDEYPRAFEALRGDETTAQVAHRLAIIIHRKLRNKKKRGNLDEIYETYRSLPEPRMMFLNKRYRHRLLKICGRASKKGAQRMMQYLSLIEDMKDCGIEIRRNEWNYAISSATNLVSRTTEAEAESALEMWKDMEAQSKRAAPNSITFNILFEAASKAGNFELAEMLYKEMKTRGIPFNRYHHVSLIHFFGLYEVADGVRAAYKEMVESGETVDTVVLNCLVFGFLRCGEDKAALKVYNFMRKTRSKYVVAKPSTTEAGPQRRKTRSKDFVAEPSTTEAGPQRQQQQIADVTPDLRTFRSLVSYFGTQKGDLGQVVQVLADMTEFQIPMHGSIFLALFDGFSRHGKVVFSEWSPDRLENILSALLRALDNKVQGLYLGTWLMIRALRSFMVCTNKHRVLEVYDEFKKRWDLPPDRVDHMNSYMTGLFNGKLPDDNLLDDRDSMFLKEKKSKVPKR
ncbi:putative pentatricopeptide repeat domain-containing protein [Colletotrichum sublineola]|uniref:Putative pentatricopeptide repeat domain-containing protein n=1 Tax=Colletotrichum sublineola TaxID=1173701 RepID=A0A066XLZ2_COLSU|nr:putative pentatricopeptide repeat domain-containing protein [Colletotrichum sublineola]